MLVKCILESIGRMMAFFFRSPLHETQERDLWNFIAIFSYTGCFF